MGKTFYTIGLINGGVAPNVISPDADAELMFRTVGDHAELRRADRTRGRRIGRRSRMFSSSRPSVSRPVPGFDTEFRVHHRHPVPRSLGRPAPARLRLGHRRAHGGRVRRDCGSHRAVELYEQMARELLAQLKLPAPSSRCRLALPGAWVTSCRLGVAREATARNRAGGSERFERGVRGRGGGPNRTRATAEA